MSKVAAGHPGEERLLRLADGELAPRHSAAVRDHLEACWQCRAEMESIQGAVADCVHYRKTVLQAQLPPPPAPWRNLSAGFAAVDREVAAESSWWRHLWRSVSPPRFWVPAVAAALLVTLVLVPWLRVTPSVQAAELLRRAVAAAESRPRLDGTARRLQVKTKSKKLVYSTASSPGAAADLRPVKALFDSANYDWNDPLSAQAYLAWHDRAASKTDEVTPEGEGFYQIKTRAAEGEMIEATLRLRQNDLQPVQGLFKFRGEEWVELTEAPAEPEAIAAARVPAPSIPAASAQPSLASIADELRVLSALHRLGADLGDPIEIVRTGSQVEVKGFGIDSRRRGQIEQALQAMPAVSLRFVDEAAPSAFAAESGPGSTAVKSASSPLQEYLDQRLGGRVAIEQFANEVFDRYESIMARAHAIQRLSARFADPTVLSPADRAGYRAMQRDHAQALVKLERELAGILRPVAPPTTSPVQLVGPSTGQSLLQLARRLEHSVSMLLGAASFSGDASTLPARIAAEQAALERITQTFLESMGQ